MRDLRLNNPNRKNKKTAVIVVVFLVFGLVLFFFPNKISNTFYYTSSPIQNSLSSLGSKTYSLLSSFLNSDKIKIENERLKKERMDLIAEILFLREIREENQILREALNLQDENDFDFVLAKVSSFDLTGDSFLIDKGRRDQLSHEMPVITSRGVVVGQIVEVYDNFSRVMLITHKDSPFFDARVQGTKTPGIIKGEGNFSLILDLLSKEEEITRGKGVISMGEVFPGGLIVGMVEEVTKIDAEPFQKAKIRPLFNPQNIERVFVVTNYQK